MKKCHRIKVSLQSLARYSVVLLFACGISSFSCAQDPPADSQKASTEVPASMQSKDSLAEPGSPGAEAAKTGQSAVPAASVPVQSDKSQEKTVTAPSSDTTAKRAAELLNDAISRLAETMAPGSTAGSSSSSKSTSNVSTWPITGGQIFWAIVFFSVAFFTIRYLTRALETIAERWTNLRLLIKRLVPIIRILGWTLVIFMIIAGILQPPIETLIAFTASAGIAIGFASQDILKNVFGGLMILLDRPFQVGDKIEASGHYGEVVQIGLRTVRLVTPDDNLVSVPNGEIMNQPVSNANAGESNCQVVAEFFLPAGIDLQRAEKIAYRAAAVSRYVYLNKPIAVIFKNEIHENRSLLKMRLKAYVLDIRYEFPFASEMTRIVLSEFLKAGLITTDQMEHYPPARAAKRATTTPAEST